MANICNSPGILFQRSKRACSQISVGLLLPFVNFGYHVPEPDTVPLGPQANFIAITEDFESRQEIRFILRNFPSYCVHLPMPHKPQEI